MATVATYAATLRTRRHNASSVYNSNSAIQEFYDSASNNMCGIIYFSGLNLTNKVITGISFKVSAAQAGYGAGSNKTVYLRKSNYQSASQSGINGAAYAGDALGTFAGSFYGNTTTNQLSGTLLANLGAYFQQGNNTLCIYNPSPSAGSQGWASNYLKWTSLSMTVTYEDGISQPALSTSAIDMGSAVTISTNRIGAATHTLRYSFAGASGTIATGVTTSVSWTPPASLAARIPSATSGLCTIYCDSYYGATLAGTKQVSITLNVPASVVPTIGSVTTSEATSGLAAQFGGYVQGKSKLAIIAAATGVQGSSITTIRATIGGKTYTGGSVTTDTLTTSGSNTLTITATDSRGRTASTTRAIAVVAYAAPTITAFRAERCNAAGTAAQMDGNRVRLRLAAAVSALNNKNTMSCKVAYRKSGSTAWTVDKTYTHSAYKVDISNNLLSAIYDPLSSYELQVQLTDFFGTQYSYTDIDTKTVLLDFKGDGSGVGVGKIAELSNALEVNPDWAMWAGGRNLADPKFQYNGITTDANTAKTNGYYRVNNGAANIIAAHGLLFVSCNDTNAWVMQVFHSVSLGVYHRFMGGDVWNAWHRLYDDQTIIPITSGGTGASSPAAALQNLGVSALGRKIVIDQAANFNAFVTPGTWVISSNATITGSPVSNVPSTYAGTLVVKWALAPDGKTWGHEYVLQRYETYKGMVYQRQSENSGSTWSAWREFLYKETQAIKDVLVGDVTGVGTATVAVTFSRTLSAAPFVTVTQNSGTPTGAKVTAATTTGFSIQAGATGTSWRYKAEVF